ncbi:SDR family oxidoreductase [Acidocella sp.]|uniref:SDR family oxidoreductase n=1 Tax=Acidocella sp. TaxID=50710 RepID=UPI003D04F444
MNLGLKSRSALVCAASAGLGRACALALAQEGVEVTITGRNQKRLEATAQELRDLTGAKISTAVGDITSVEGRAAALSACPSPDILVNNAGGPPPGDFRTFSDADWHAALNANLLTPIALIKATIDGMISRKFGRIVNITSGSVKSPLGNLALSNTARTGLTGFVAGLSRQVAEYNVTINNLLPGPFDTDRLRKTMEDAARDNDCPVEEMVRVRAEASPAKRIGRPEEFGAACAFLCSAQAGFIVGQNILLDGGAFNSTM